IHEYLQGVPIEEEMSTLRFRMGMAKTENASLRGKIRTMEAIKTITLSQERRTHIEIEQHLASGVMDAPTIPVYVDSSKGNFKDAIDIGLDVDHPVPVVKQKEDGIFISQDKYVAEILKKFDFLSVKTASTPIETQKPLVKDKEAADVDVTPKTSHLQGVKRIFRYLKAQPKLGLWYLKVSLFNLKAYSDSDYAGANLDRKSTTRATLVKGRLLEVTTAKQSKELASPKQTAFGVNTPRCDEDSLELKGLMVFFVLICVEKDEVGVNAGYEKMSDKLTFYKAFFSPQWKFLIHTILQCLSAKTTSWNEFSSTMHWQSSLLPQTRSLTSQAKPAKSEGFEQIIDFINRISIRYALTASPTIFTSCIKQFWSTAKVKTVNDEVRVQALIDVNRVTIKESSIRRTLKLDDENGISCLANDDIFTGLANIVLKPPPGMNLVALWHQQSSVLPQTRSLTSQDGWYWFSMVITPLFENMLVPAAEEVGFCQLEDGWYWFSMVITPLFENMLVPAAEEVEHQLPLPSNDPIPDADTDSLTLQELMDLCTRLSNKLEEEKRALKEKSFKTTQVDTAAPVENIEKSSKKGRMIANMDEDVEDIDEEEPAKVEDVLEVVKVAKLFTKVVTTTEPTTTAAQVPKASTLRRRRGVIIQDPEETATSLIVHTKVKSKDKGKGILIEEPKPLKRQAQIKADEAFEGSWNLS
nr:hypothetical protein [Tanacetum cinerariifolium]